MESGDVVDGGVGGDEVVGGVDPHAGCGDVVVPVRVDVGVEEGFYVAVAAAAGGPLCCDACWEWFAHADEVVGCVAEGFDACWEEGLDEGAAFGLVLGAHEVDAA